MTGVKQSQLLVLRLILEFDKSCLTRKRKRTEFLVESNPNLTMGNSPWCPVHKYISPVSCAIKSSFNPSLSTFTKLTQSILFTYFPPISGMNPSVTALSDHLTYFPAFQVVTNKTGTQRATVFNKPSLYREAMMIAIKNLPSLTNFS